MTGPLPEPAAPAGATGAGGATGGAGGAGGATFLGRIAFAVLLCATVAAFFVTQRIKSEPPVVQGTNNWTRWFSPTPGSTRPEARISFRIKHSDDVTVFILDANGDAVRTLVSDRPLHAYRRIYLRWNGREDGGSLAPPGPYRVRIALRREARSITVPNTIQLVTSPPSARVTSVVPAGTAATAAGRGPAILPAPGGGTAVDVHFTGAITGKPSFLVYRTTDPTRPRLVARFTGRKGSQIARWDGRVAGRPAPSGTYLVVVKGRGRAGNMGSSAPIPPRPGPNGRLPGRGGITVRHLAAQAPLEPVTAGAVATFFVDARGERYAWSVRRLGAARPIARGRSRGGRLTLRAPRGASGVYLLELRTRRHAASVPFAVRARKAGRVLVVLPTLTWLGRDATDDNGDGLPDLLDLGAPVRLSRALSRPPADLLGGEASLLAHLDRERLRYDITTDVALARGSGPRLVGHAGVLIPGDMRWLPAHVRRELEAYVRAGGSVASLGVGSLRRSVELSSTHAVHPTQPARTDALGARIGALTGGPAELLALAPDEVGLFAGGGGAFTGVAAYEETLALPAGARRVAAAGGPAGRPVIVAYRLDRGLVIRTGVPGWGARLSSDPDAVALLRRIWTLLATTTPAPEVTS